MGDLPPSRRRRPREVNVLVTGFGAFRNTAKNPSWESVKLLSDLDVDLLDDNKTVSIDISYIPVEYDYIIDALPFYHSNSHEKLPLPDHLRSDPEIAARDDFNQHKRYDFVLHVGQGRSGGIRIETRGHQLGYRLLDAKQKLAPVVAAGKGVTDADAGAPEQLQFMSSTEKEAGMSRGYPLDSEVEIGLNEDGEIKTDIDVTGLVSRLAVSFPDFSISSSTNAGRYLCEFTYFGSMAEARISQAKVIRSGANAEASRVLFVHVPPVNDPLSVNDMAEVLQSLVRDVASGLAGGRIQE